MSQLDDVNVTVGAELPDVTFVWKDDDGNAIDFSAVAHTFAVKAALEGSTADLALSLTASGAADGTVTIVAAEDAFNALIPGRTYDVQVWATRTSDAKEREPAVFKIRARAAIA